MHDNEEVETSMGVLVSYIRLVSCSFGFRSSGGWPMTVGPVHDVRIPHATHAVLRRSISFKFQSLDLEECWTDCIKKSPVRTPRHVRVPLCLDTGGVLAAVFDCQRQTRMQVAPWH